MIESFEEFASRVLWEKHKTLKTVFDKPEEFAALDGEKKKKIMSGWADVPLLEKPPMGFKIHETTTRTPDEQTD